MTAIVGIAAKGRVWMGADRCSTTGQIVTTERRAKVRRAGPLLVGACGTASIMDALTGWAPPPAGRLAPEAYIARKVVPALRQLLRHVLDNQGQLEGGLVLGYKGQLWSVGCDFGLCSDARDLIAVGSGGQVALGAALAYADRAPEARILGALAIAAATCLGVAAPFDVVRT